MSHVEGPQGPLPDQRVSDADRDHATSVVHAAVSDGRLGLEEMDARISAALSARTRSELDRVVADLAGAAPHPPGAIRPAPGTPLRLEVSHSALRRSGRLSIPARVEVVSNGSSVVLDLLDATFQTPHCDLVLDVKQSSLTVLVPDHVEIDTDALVLKGSTISGARPDPGIEPRVLLRVSGSLRHSSATVGVAGRWRRWRRRRQALRRQRQDPPHTR